MGSARGLSCATAAEAAEKQNAENRKSADKIPLAEYARGQVVCSAKAKILDGLMAGSVVAGLVIDAEGREAFGGAQFDFDFAPAGVMRFVTWMVSQYILVTQLHADFSGDVREIFELFD